MKLKWLIWPLVVVFLSLPTVTSMMRPGIFQMHDDISVMRLLEMKQCFADGQIPCRWVANMGFGFGYPQFNYYGPLPYYIAMFFDTLGFNLMDAVKISFGLALILGNLSMFYLGRKLFGPWGGLISAMAYAYLPYRASDLYSRGAMGETWAFVFLPLILLFIQKLIETPTSKNIVYLALSVAGLLVTHNISVLMFAPMAMVWTVILVFKDSPSLRGQIPDYIRTVLVPRILLFVKAGVLAICLAAFFFLPVVLESRLVHTESLLSGYFNFLAHFVTLKQLFFTSFWGYGSSEIGFTDDLSFFFGPVHLLLGLVVVILTGAKIIQGLSFSARPDSRLYKDSPYLIVLVAAGLFLISAFLTHSKTTFIWQNLSFLAYLQFPWRFLVTANFFLGLIVGGVVIGLPENKARWLAVIFAFMFIFLNLAYFRPNRWFDLSVNEKFSGLSWEKQMTVSIFDYLPKSAKLPPGAPAKRLPKVVSGGPVDILDYVKQSNRQTFKTEGVTEAKIQMQLFDFPTWQVKIDGQKIKYTSETDLGLVTFTLPAGNHAVEVKLTDSLPRKLGNGLTLVGLLVTLLILWKKDETQS